MPKTQMPASERDRSEEHTSELQSHSDLVCRLLLDLATTHLYTLSLHDALPIYLAIAEVAERQVLEVAGQDGGIGLDRVRGQAEVERTAVGPLAEVHAPLEGDAKNADAGLGERQIGRAHV